MPLFRIFLAFVLSFAIEVRVKASDPSIIEPAQVPCVFASNCNYSSAKSASYFGNKREKYFFAPGTTIKKEFAHDELILVAGSVLVQKQTSAGLWRFLHGEVHSAKGDFLLHVGADDKVEIFNLSAESLVLKLRDGEVVGLPVGTKMWVAGIATDAKNLKSTVMPIKLDEFQKNLSEFAPAWSPQDHKKGLNVWFKKWGNRFEKVSKIYMDSAKRELAEARAQEMANKAQELEAQERAQEQKQNRLQYFFGR
ncbi:MAG: hypothetical protein ACLGGX_06990 [Bdellovibrionia bacterium]